MQDGMLALEVRGLTKDYGDFVLKDVSFSLPHGYIMGFIGQNGAGKSTTIKCIMNLVHPDSGSIKVFGIDALRDERKVKQMVGYVGEEQPFYDEFTVSQMARFVARFYLHWDEGLFKGLCRKYGISPDKKVKSLSKGTRVKFALSLALAHKPRLLILDEPMSGLDPVARHEVVQELLDVIQDENRSVFFSSHIVEDLERVADYIGLIHQGTLLFSREKDDILSNWKRITLPAELAPRLKPYAFHTKGTPESTRTGHATASLQKAPVTVVVNRFVDLIRDFPEIQRSDGIEVQSLGLEDIMLVVAEKERSGLSLSAGDRCSAPLSSF
ncbi:MAG TPA: ABC transporter ATP-binding protein [Firmicutes bacterium]|nr:ABC transporter ATP-binding protein [Candidatus Fermentithermobacillaceae bacterium]